ncbi:hypothetical protein ACFL5L_00575 [candidate division KSB1 bacterium]
MAANVILALGSPIKDHTAPSMLGPAITTGTATVGGTSVAGVLGKAAALAGGSSKVLTGASSSISLVAGEVGAAANSSTATGTYTATQLTGIGLAKTATLGSVFVSILFTVAAVAAGYLGYLAVKGIWELTSKTNAKA